MAKKKIPAKHRRIIEGLAKSGDDWCVQMKAASWNIALAEAEAAWVDMTGYHQAMAERFRGSGLTAQVRAVEEFGERLVGIHYDCFRNVLATQAPDLSSLVKALRRFSEWEMQVGDEMDLLLAQLEGLCPPG